MNEIIIIVVKSMGVSFQALPGKIYEVIYMMPTPMPFPTPTPLPTPPVNWLFLFSIALTMISLISFVIWYDWYLNDRRDK